MASERGRARGHYGAIPVSTACPLPNLFDYWCDPLSTELATLPDLFDYWCDPLSTEFATLPNLFRLLVTVVYHAAGFAWPSEMNLMTKFSGYSCARETYVKLMAVFGSKSLIPMSANPGGVKT